MKTLVTGGCGFIGSHVVETLVAAGHSVCVLDNMSTGRRENLQHVADRGQVVECDIAQPGEWKKFFEGVDWVIHLAALADLVPSIRNPEMYFRSNVDGTFHVLEASRFARVKRMIYAASSSCYGFPDIYPTPESARIDPRYPYALTKWLGEQLVLHWAKVYKVPALSLRLFNVYGPRSRTGGTYGAVFGVFLAQKLAGKPFTVVGDGNQTRDFTYVSDVVRAIIMAAQNDLVGQAYNVGSGRTVSVNKVAELLGGEKVHIPKRPGEPDSTWADIGKIQRELGWRPDVSVEEGVGELLKQIDYWREAPVWEPQTIAKETREWFVRLQDS